MLIETLIIIMIIAVLIIINIPEEREAIVIYGDDIITLSIDRKVTIFSDTLESSTHHVLPLDDFKEVLAKSHYDTLKVVGKIIHKR